MPQFSPDSASTFTATDAVVSQGQAFAFCLLVTVLAVAAVTDWRTGLIPNKLTLPAMAAGLTLAGIVGVLREGVAGGFVGFGWALLCLAIGLVPTALLSITGVGLGGGDAKLMGVVGAVSALPECVLATALYSLTLAVAMALFIMFQQRIAGRTAKRLFALSFGLASGVRHTMPEDSPKIPFAVALFFGGGLAAAEHLLGLELPWSAATAA